VWGFAEVERTHADGLSAGTRVYGYLPPSSHLIVQPERADAQGFLDGSAHRAALPGAYQRYLVTDRDPLYREDTEELQMLLRPLFITSFLIDDELADDGLASRGPVLISSASSKTAIGVAFRLAQRTGTHIIGLTSARSAEFVERLGIYDRTVTYDAIGSLERGPATYVDIAGDGNVRHAVHDHFGDELQRSMAVGATHRTERPSAPRTGERPGCRRRWPTRGTRSAPGPANGSRWFAATASRRFSRRIWTSSAAGYPRPRRTSSPSADGGHAQRRGVGTTSIRSASS
jgi:hypothetical protein